MPDPVRAINNTVSYHYCREIPPTHLRHERTYYATTLALSGDLMQGCKIFAQVDKDMQRTRATKNTYFPVEIKRTLVTWIETALPNR